MQTLERALPVWDPAFLVSLCDRNNRADSSTWVVSIHLFSLSLSRSLSLSLSLSLPLSLSHPLFLFSLAPVPCNHIVPPWNTKPCKALTGNSYTPYIYLYIYRYVCKRYTSRLHRPSRFIYMYICIYIYIYTYTCLHNPMWPGIPGWYRIGNPKGFQGGAKGKSKGGAIRKSRGSSILGMEERIDH